MLNFEGKMLFTLSSYVFPSQRTLKVKIRQRGSVLEHLVYVEYIFCDLNTSNYVTFMFNENVMTWKMYGNQKLFQCA